METSTRIYSLRPLTKRIIILILLFTLGADWLVLFIVPTVANATQHHNSEAIFALLFVVVVSLAVLYADARSWNVRLELSPKGITFYNPPFYNIYTPWQNVTGLRNKKGWEVSESSLGAKRFVKTLSGEALLLREPARKGMPIREGRLREVAAIKRVSLLPNSKDWKKDWNEIPFDPFQFFKNQREKEDFYKYIQVMIKKNIYMKNKVFCF
jgi:hypothetical protein